MEPVVLSRENWDKLLQNERNLTQILGDIDKAEQCGIECQAYRQSVQVQLAQIQNMKVHFKPKDVA